MARTAQAQALAPALLGVVAGAALQLQQPRLWAAWSYGAAAAAALCVLLLVLRPARGGAAWIGVLAAVTMASAAVTGWRAAAYASDGLDPALEGRDLVVTGLVAALPHRDDAGVRVRFDVQSARLDGRAVALPSRLLVSWYAGEDSAPPVLRPGETWQWTLRPRAPHGQANPHGFDYELWLWEQGLQATATVRTGARDPPPRRLGAGWEHPLEQARLRVREAIEAEVTEPRLAGVLTALVVGDQAAIERADWDVFRATGVAHLMSISGLHVTMFAWAAAALVGALWRRSARLCLAWPAQQAGLAGGVLLAAGYAVFSGWGVPAQRTVCMLAAVGLLRLGARDWPWPWVWLLACAAVVAVDPWALTQAGFWLSFVAVGVLFASGPRGDREDEAPRRPAARALAALRGLLREQWIVTVALTPLSLLLFGQVSLVGLAANLLAIPWVTLVVTPLGLAGVALAPLWRLGAHAVAALVVVLQWLAALPFATWSAPAPPLWAGAAGVLGGLLVAAQLPLSMRALGLPLLLPVLLWQAPRPPAGEFELLAADIGQGNAVLVRTATHALLYDAGPAYGRETDAGQRVLVPLLRAFDERLDLLVLSHRDTDHTGGAAAVLRAQPGAGMLSSLEAGHALLALRPARRCHAGQAWDWDGVRFEVLHPRPADYTERARPNTLSCVLRVAGARSRALLAGDLEQPQEQRLAADPVSVRADLLLVPHHGSRTSSSAPFLDAVRPRVALVQAGYRNRFGHPAPDVMERYRARGIAVFGSPHCGAAAWSSAAPGAVQCQRAQQPRYWQHQAPPPLAAGG